MDGILNGVAHFQQLETSDLLLIYPASDAAAPSALQRWPQTASGLACWAGWAGFQHGFQAQSLPHRPLRLGAAGVAEQKASPVSATPPQSLIPELAALDTSVSTSSIRPVRKVLSKLLVWFHLTLPSHLVISMHFRLLTDAPTYTVRTGSRDPACGIGCRAGDSARSGGAGGAPAGHGAGWPPGAEPHGACPGPAPWPVSPASTSGEIDDG